MSRCRQPPLCRFRPLACSGPAQSQADSGGMISVQHGLWRPNLKQHSFEQHSLERHSLGPGRPGREMFSPETFSPETFSPETRPGHTGRSELSRREVLDRIERAGT